MLLLIVVVVVILLGWNMRPKHSGYVLPKRKCACGNCPKCKTCGKAATPLNAPSRKVELTDAAGDAQVSSFEDRGSVYDSSAYLNQNYTSGLQKTSPSEYELERHRIVASNPEKRVMDEIYALNDDQRLEQVLAGMSDWINPDPLVIKSNETRDEMLFRSLTDIDGELQEGILPPIDQMEQDMLIRQSNGTNGQKAPTGYI